MKKWTIPLIALVFPGFLLSPGMAAIFDHSTYDGVVHRYVDDRGMVNYAAIRTNSLSTLESYFERMADADLAGWPIAERVAFWINVYNARVIYMIAHKPYMKKVDEDEDFFNRPFKVAGAMLTLNDIDYRVLRGTANPDNKKGPIDNLTLPKRDIRIDFALVRGALSSPRMRNFAYTAENVENALEESPERFANDARYIEIIDGKLKLSSMLKWYRKDFESVGGVAAYLSGLMSVEKRGDADAVKQLLASDFKDAVYAYDWTVNANNDLSDTEALQ